MFKTLVVSDPEKSHHLLLCEPVFLRQIFHNLCDTAFQESILCITIYMYIRQQWYNACWVNAYTAYWPVWDIMCIIARFLWKFRALLSGSRCCLLCPFLHVRVYWCLISDLNACLLSRASKYTLRNPATTLTGRSKLNPMVEPIGKTDQMTQ